MKILKNRFDKEAINALPVVSFEGPIHTIISEEEADKAVDFLLSHPILGFDTETKPSFTKGRGMNKVALLQVSTEEQTFLFRLNQIGLPKSVVRLLSDREVLKVALSWQDDMRQLQRRKRFRPGRFLELQRYVKYFGIEDLSLQKLYANVFGKKISKSQRLTNWEADCLTEAQKRYAATDSWACVRIFNELHALKHNGNYVVDRVEAEED
ncbi:MAG: 3'-5' exonuclease domain-containing protein 2 [Bacteroidales bacterium]|nr:3'-5' exonuclease domain-containing protein 2 [Candidatus Physcousia equi]